MEQKEKIKTKASHLQVNASRTMIICYLLFRVKTKAAKGSKADRDKDKDSAKDDRYACIAHQ